MSILQIARHNMYKRKAEVAEEDVRSGDLLVGSSLLDRYKRLKTNHDTDNYNRNVKLSNLCPNAPPFFIRKDSDCQDDVEKENKTGVDSVASPAMVDWRRTVVCKYKHIAQHYFAIHSYNHHEHLQLLHRGDL